ncbi:MAG: DUF262 domain-containing protein [bacterium]
MPVDQNDDEDNFEEIQSEIDDKETDLAPYKLITYGADYTLQVLVDKLEAEDIIVPPFQRKYIWPLVKASKLIESFLLGLPVPQIFLYKEVDTETLTVVDGQQRLRTIQYFFNEIFKERAFRLLNVKQQWEGKKYTELKANEQRRLRDSILRATIFQQTDPNDNSSIFEVFERLNTGGMTLREQEIRNCVIRGNINSFLEGLNNYPTWRNLFGNVQIDTRMRDIEMILRFFALYDNLDNYSKPMKDFLTLFMRGKKNLSEDEKSNYETIFKQTMDFINEKIGPRAFRIRTGINIAVFDAISVSLAKLDLSGLSDVKENFELLISDTDFIDLVSVHTTDKDKVIQRISLATRYFQNEVHSS